MVYRQPIGVEDLAAVDAAVAVSLEHAATIHRVDLDPLRLPPLPHPRRLMIDAARRFLLDRAEHAVVGGGGGGANAPENDPDFDAPPRLTLRALERIPMSRSRDRILANLDDMYREAFERAKAAGDQTQMVSLDAAYRREQLYFEILLDIRDAVERSPAR